MMRILVLGIGNRLMTDDGIGVRVVETLAADNDLENVEFVAGETDVDYCLSRLPLADRYIIIDGAALGKVPGSVDVFPLQQVYEAARSALSFHDFDLFHAIKAENLCKDGLLITVEICSIEFSVELSSLMSERFDGIVCEIKEIIDDYKSSIISLSPRIC